MIGSFPGLSKLCDSLEREMGYHFSIADVVYFIRHICIAEGCKNACSHCFSNAPDKVIQTDLKGYSSIMDEVGRVVASTGRPLRFFHMGASTDPAFVKGFSDYLQVWLERFPSFQPVKVFSHGWPLFDNHYSEEFDQMARLLRSCERENLRIVLSFDHFSRLARENRSLYLSNIRDNLFRLVSLLGKERVRVEVFYLPERNHCNATCTLQYWIDRVKEGYAGSFREMVSDCQSHVAPVDLECASVTVDLFTIFETAGLSPKDLIQMSRDCDSIFPSGRGNRFFGVSQDDRQHGLDIQKQKVLYALEDYKYKYDGVIIAPNGSAQMVDYWGYHLGKRLNGGNSLIDYMSCL